MNERPNPWGLTPKEMQMCELLVEHQGVKRVAHKSGGMSDATIRKALRNARKKSGTLTLVGLAVAFDRTQRGAE